ncbi:MAG: sulfatase-like hydrolase/transferase [Armatimonadetes bacterium]|nr:sulfatase-like hydrolase/transferase [Armatimonadota bacterium]
MGEKLVREQLRCYHGQVTMIDACVGRILKALADQGLEKDTLVVFLSDHGDMQGAHGMVGKSANAYYEEIVRVPLMVRYPRAIKAGTVIHGHANSVDIMPTLLEYAGVPIPRGVHGRSLKPMLEGKAADQERLGFCERGAGVGSRMIRTESWKYAVYDDGRRELFDLKKDPGEMRDLSADSAHRSTLAELHRKLRLHMDETNDPALGAFPKA